MANLFGVEAFDLYLYAGQGFGIDLEFSDPVSVLVPSGFAKLSEGQQVFLLSRVMADIGRNLQAIDKLGAEALAVLLAAAARTVDGSFGVGLADEELLSNLARRVSRSLPWLGRGAVEEARAQLRGRPAHRCRRLAIPRAAQLGARGPDRCR